MATQTSFDWNAFNQSLEGTREDQAAKRAQRDAADTGTINNIVSSATSQANDRAAREAARNAGVYNDVYSTPGSDNPSLGGTSQSTRNGVGSTSQALGGTPTRPGAEGYAGSNIEEDPYGAYTSDISGLEPVQYAQNELNRRNQLQQIAQSTAGGWETGSLAPSKRQKGEQASPWDSLNEKLGVVATNAENNRAALEKQFNEDKQTETTAAFNAKEKLKLANDYSRKDAFNEIMNDFYSMIDKYSKQAQADTAAGKKLTAEPYTLALDEFRKKYGGDLPDERNLTTNSVVNQHFNERHQDLMNQYEDAVRQGQTEQQQLMQSRLNDPTYGLQTNDGWQYGSGSDTGGIWSL